MIFNSLVDIANQFMILYIKFCVLWILFILWQFKQVESVLCFMWRMDPVRSVWQGLLHHLHPIHLLF